MDAHEDSPRIEVLSVSNTGRRRRWTDVEKLWIVKESYQSGETIAAVALRNELSRPELCKPNPLSTKPAAAQTDGRAWCAMSYRAPDLEG